MNMNMRICRAVGRRMPIVLAVGYILVAPSLAAAPISAAPPSTAMRSTEVVEQFDAALVEAMKAGKRAGLTARIAIMQKAVNAAFDLPRISQEVLGHYWSGLSHQDQRTFVDLLGQLTVVSYAANFDSYSNQRFTITAVHRRGDIAFVSTRFLAPNGGETHSFDYVLQASTAGQWKIVNVIADGVSDVAIKRAEYMDLLGKGSFSDLVDALQKQIKRARHPD